MSKNGDIQILIGLRLESCRLSKSSYSFEFDGEKDGMFYNFEVSTTCYLTFLNTRKDACEEFSKYIWDMLETNLTNIMVREEQNEIRFEFENNKNFIVWRDESLIDDLLVVRNTKTNDWFAV